MGWIVSRPATVVTLVGALVWTPNSALLGFSAHGDNWIAILVLLVPFVYCAFRLFRAPVARPAWSVAFVSLVLGLLGTVGILGDLASGYVVWAEVAWSVATCAFLVFAACNWRGARRRSSAVRC